MFLPSQCLPFHFYSESKYHILSSDQTGMEGLLKVFNIRDVVWQESIEMMSMTNKVLFWFQIREHYHLIHRVKCLNGY